MFIYKNWDKFCSKLVLQTKCITSTEALSIDGSFDYVVIKHDVETNVQKALNLAVIENKYGISATYYVQLYLLESKDNISILKKIQSLGHEVTYHYDVLDANNGDWIKAEHEFVYALDKFAKNGFEVRTVCPHGNPVKERVGWNSNKDFFRNKIIREKYNYITDIVLDVNKFGKEKLSYISDAGYGWKLISDISNNDKAGTVPDVELNNLDSVLELVKSGETLIISSHPHRWYSNGTEVMFRVYLFKSLRFTVNTITKIPLMNKVLSRFYFLAKKI